MINVAKHRLAVSDDDVTIIAYDLGLQYSAHFSRMLRRITGQPPAEYRRMIIEQN